ncbi:MAG: damage-inducible protein DinB [Burkholderiales bacterium]|nr:damage-inducible protein DinB [Burkholderiales bacterium]MDE2609354.1 damage-inducible protein DinB [Burkholderiales bacterium]
MAASLKAHFDMLARYNAWANTRLFEAAGNLSDADYRADRGAFFKSVHGTLNHLLVTDRVWMRRFTGEGDAPDRLDAILYESFDHLRGARETEDARIVGYVTGLDEAALAGVITYRRVSTPEVLTQPLAPAFAHWFNHHAHHRGQVHALLTGLGRHAPELDLLIFQRLVDRGLA